MNGRRQRLEEAIAESCRRIAPLWPLTSFVAVNPFLGFANQGFEETCATFRRVAGVELLMPLDWYRAAIERGDVTDADLLRALADMPRDWPVPDSLDALRASLRGAAAVSLPVAGVPTVADVLDALAAGDRQLSRTAFMVEEIARFCASYFDRGQSVWRLPWRDLRPYAAWREAMRHDRNPEAMGVTGFRATVAALPDSPVDAIEAVVRALGLPDGVLVDYLHRALFDVRGWAG
jgi:uncharacterized protein